MAGLANALISIVLFNFDKDMSFTVSFSPFIILFQVNFTFIRYNELCTSLVVAQFRIINLSVKVNRCTFKLSAIFTEGNNFMTS